MQEEIELAKKPTPADEGEKFSTAEENADKRTKSHEIEKIKLDQGSIGKFIGSTNTSLTITFMVLVFSFVLLMSIFAFSSYISDYQISERISSVLYLIVSIITLCIGYIFGSK